MHEYDDDQWETELSKADFESFASYLDADSCCGGVPNPSNELNNSFDFKPEENWDGIVTPAFIESSIDILNKFKSNEDSPTLEIINALTYHDEGDSMFDLLEQIEQRSILLQRLCRVSRRSNLTTHLELDRWVRQNAKQFLSFGKTKELSTSEENGERGAMKMALALAKREIELLRNERLKVRQYLEDCSKEILHTRVAYALKCKEHEGYHELEEQFFDKVGHLYPAMDDVVKQFKICMPKALRGDSSVTLRYARMSRSQMLAVPGIGEGFLKKISDAFRELGLFGRFLYGDYTKGIAAITLPERNNLPLTAWALSESVYIDQLGIHYRDREQLNEHEKWHINAYQSLLEHISKRMASQQVDISDATNELKRFSE